MSSTNRGSETRTIAFQLVTTILPMLIMAGGVSKIHVVGVAIRPKTRQNFVDVDAITSKTETDEIAVIGIVERFVESDRGVLI